MSISWGAMEAMLTPTLASHFKEVYFLEARQKLINSHPVWDEQVLWRILDLAIQYDVDIDWALKASASKFSSVR